MNIRPETANGQTISNKQLGAVIFLSVLSPVIRIFPGKCAELAGKGAWLSPVFAAPLLYLLALLINKMMRRDDEQEGLPDIIKRAAGRTGGRIIMGVLALWLLFYIGVVVRASAERLISTIFQTGSPVPFSIVIIAAALVLALGQLKSLGRMAEIFLVMIGTVLVVTLAAGIKNCSANNLLPVTAYDIPDILLGSLPVINVAGAGVYIMFLDFKVKGKRNTGYKELAWILITIGALTAVTMGVLSAGFIIKLQYPYFVMVRDITILGIIERIEAVVIVLWVVTDLIYMAVILKVIGRLSVCAIEKGTENFYASAASVISLILAFLAAVNSFELNNIIRNVMPLVNILITIVIIPLLIVIGKVRRKKA